MRYEFDNDADWHQIRKEYVSGTQLAAILGLDPYTSPNQVYQEKRRNKTPKEFITNANVEMGHVLEPLIIRAASAALNLQTRPSPTDVRLFVTHSMHKLGCSPDSELENGSPLEAKSTMPHNLYAWSSIPTFKYLCQLYAQQICLEKPYGYLAIMGTNLVQYRSSEIKWPLLIFKLNTDPILTNIILNSVDKFWNFEGKVLTKDTEIATIIKMKLLLNLEKIKIGEKSIC